MNNLYFSIFTSRPRGVLDNSFWRTVNWGIFTSMGALYSHAFLLHMGYYSTASLSL